MWDLWKKRGWSREARHYVRLEEGIVKCLLCPNHCLLEPKQRGRCSNRINWDGRLYTLVYGNPCSFHIDPIEKKPLMHFLPSTGVFSIATSGCCLRCLNCQNWEISQKRPEETKDASGDEVRATPQRVNALTMQDAARLSMFPEDVVNLAERFRCPSIAYTYAEPIVFYEYMQDAARLAHEKNIKNVWITCGHITSHALEELCPLLDAANVNLKSHSEEIYADLNAGRLYPVLEALKILKDHGVWFEVTNLIVPTYTDKTDMIRRMCDWLLENIGPDYPLHFSRFHPAFKLTHLPPTPLDILLEARNIARQAGLRYVYIGNVRELEDAETTFCPRCKKAVVERIAFSVVGFHLKNGKCGFCGESIVGVWTA
ncbi:MAG: AmmeMemoRadiSam system radical SAM enzyme [Verrucomicrobia bacterium]|nr:AmmeMemoRadiSam system radical SAM enzyme [Verrucomicrobiota bacterium]